MTRITTDLERIGDEAKKIARVILRLTESEGSKAYYIGVLVGQVDTGDDCAYILTGFLSTFNATETAGSASRWPR